MIGLPKIASHVDSPDENVADYRQRCSKQTRQENRTTSQTPARKQQHRRRNMHRVLWIMGCRKLPCNCWIFGEEQQQLHSAARGDTVNASNTAGKPCDDRNDHRDDIEQAGYDTETCAGTPSSKSPTKSTQPPAATIWPVPYPPGSPLPHRQAQLGPPAFGLAGDEQQQTPALHSGLAAMKMAPTRTRTKWAIPFPAAERKPPA